VKEICWPDWQNIFLVSGLSFLLGIIFAVSFGNAFLLFAWGFILMATFLAAFLLKVSDNIRVFFYLFLVALGFSLGAGRVALSPDYSHELDSYIGQKLEFVGTVVRAPDEQETQTKLVVEPKSHHARILLVIERYPQYALGDQVSVRGKLTAPKNQVSATSTFDYVSYLAKDGIYYEMYRPIVDKTASASGLNSWLNASQNYLAKTLSAILPEPQAGLLGGILLGMRQGIGTEISKAFTSAGVSHILVLSGYNITLAAEVILRAFSFLPRVIGGISGMIVIIFFGMIAGGGAVVWRAVGMAMIALYARLTGRLFNVASAMLFTAVVFSLINPQSIVSDLGLQLGFLALLGLVYLSPIIEQKFLMRVTERFTLRETAATTFGAQIAVLPLIWYATGKVTLIGFVSNLLILPLVPSIMIWGAIAITGAFFSPILVWPISFSCYLLLSLVIYLVNFFAGLPFGSVSFSAPFWLVIFVYLALLACVVHWWRNQPRV
jgi:competence protein ComEC